MGKAMSRNVRPRVLIMGACSAIGRACAEALHSHGAELILSDHDGPALLALSETLGAAGRLCDILSETNVDLFAAEILDEFQTLDVLINAAGSGFERTLGMYRLSNALLPALKNNQGRTFILNVPPAEHASGANVSSIEAYWRLCGALESETRGSLARVRIACPQRLQIGTIKAAAQGEYETDGVEPSARDSAASLATRIVSLIYFSRSPDRRSALLAQCR